MGAHVPARNIKGETMERIWDVWHGIPEKPRWVPEKPTDYIGWSESFEGAKLIRECEGMFRTNTEIVEHDNTYYILKK